MAIAVKYRLYESRSGKFIGQYDTRDEAEEAAADTVATTTINAVRFRPGDYYPNPNRRGLNHPRDENAPRDPCNWNDPMRGLHPEDWEQAHRNLAPLLIIPMLPFPLLVIGFLILLFLSSHGWL
jgi:hypothetical protein